MPGWRITGYGRASEPVAEAELLRRLEHLRSDYLELRLAKAIREGIDLEAAVREQLQQADEPRPELLALAGAVATVLGLSRLLTGDHEPAREAFERAVSSFTAARDFLAGRGEYTACFGMALAMTGQPTEAERQLRRAVELGEDTPDVRRILAVSLRDSGRPEEALEALDDAVTRAPYDWQALEARAQLIEDRTTSAPSDIAASWALAGAALLAAGLAARAQHPYRRAVELLPEDAGLLLGLADALRGTGNREEALTCLRRAADVATGEELAVSVAERLSDLGDSEKALEIADGLLLDDPLHGGALDVRAIALLGLGHADEALTILDQRTRTDPEDVRVRVLQAFVLSASGKFDEAVHALEAADRLQPEHPGVRLRLAQTLINAGRENEALRTLDQVLKLDPDDPDALFLHGLLRWQIGDLAGAESELSRVVDLAPAWALPRAYLGDVLLRQGRTDEALTLLDTAITADPGLDAAWVTRGETLSELARWDEAAESFMNAVRLNPASVPALTGVGSVAREQERYADALAALDEALALQPDNAVAQATRGEVLLDQELLPEAIAALERATELEPDNAWIQQRLGEAYWKEYLQGDRPGDAESVKESLRKAADRFQRAAELDPHPERWFMTALACYQQSEFGASERYLRKTLETEPDHERAHMWLAKTLFATDRAEEALAELDHMAKDGPLPVSGETVRGRCLYAMERYEDSVAVLEVAARSDPEYQEARAALGESYRITGRLDEALTELDEAVRLEDDDAWALASRGATLSALGHEERALDDLRRAVQLDPDYAFAWGQLRLHLEGLGRQDEALLLLASAVDRDPVAPELLVEYAQALSSAERASEALAVLDEVILRKPDDTTALRLYGWNLMSLGQPVEALTRFERALAVDQENVDALTDLAEANFSIGRVEEALTIIDRALNLERTRWSLIAKSKILAGIADWPQAAEFAREAIGVPPEESSAHSVLGWVLEYSGVDARHEALHAYDEAVRLAPRDPWCLMGRADLLWLLRGPDVADKEYLGIIDVLGAAPYLSSEKQQLKGWCLYRLRRYGEAAEAYLRARSTTSDLANLLFDMGLNALDRGDPDWAAEMYRKAIDEIGRETSARVRGTVAVALGDLTVATVHANAQRDPAMTDQLLEQLTALYRKVSETFFTARA
ncbi:tetratricopeptide repeat protein [Streptomyces sp. NPDC059875]|uniref:tetratricopeptide repeat protein n=1 Tax=unclassified Streptomyces TaxID=2593676 RepID=UPI003652B0FB